MGERGCHQMPLILWLFGADLLPLSLTAPLPLELFRSHTEFFLTAADDDSDASPTPPTPVLRSRPSWAEPERLPSQHVVRGTRRARLAEQHSDAFSGTNATHASGSTPAPRGQRVQTLLCGDAVYQIGWRQELSLFDPAVLGTIALFAWWPVAQQYLWQQHSHSAEEGLAHIHLFHEPHCRGESVTLRRSADLYAPAPALALAYHSRSSSDCLRPFVPFVSYVSRSRRLHL